jgi:hypothetical protein
MLGKHVQLADIDIDTDTDTDTDADAEARWLVRRACRLPQPRPNFEGAS